MKSINPNDIQISEIKRIDLKTNLTAGGILVPLVEETISSPIDSNIGKVMIQAGQRFHAGQKIMQLDTTQIELELMKLNEEIALQENQIETRKLTLKKTLNDYKGQLELLHVDLESRQTRLSRLNQLALSGGTSKQDLLEGELDVKRTHIQIRQLEQAIHDNEASTVDEIQSLKLEKSILSRSPQDKKRIHESAHVVAPFEGVLTWLKNEEGSSIQKGESLVKLAKIEQFRVEATLSDFYANQIWQGKPAEFEYDEQHFFGSVTSIIAGEQGGILNLTIHLDQIPDQNQSLLRQKQRVDVSLITGEPKNTLVIEKGPFCKGSGLQNVFVLRGQEAFRQAANLGASNREYYQVLDGLKEHDEVIISDVSSLAHHSKINVQ